MNKTRIEYNTDFLLGKNNFWVGLGSVLNLQGVFFDYSYSKSDAEADNRALFSDWQNVGEDIEKATNKFETENYQELSFK
ncbi:hypothetical protein VB796_04825 [Arcicella sp. LKC2W]|uniref:hypothetical protein n=1 Tax=Arcicella sp. LKC2W TaxID=2984198 RepID=UPI002B206DD3|nr:hypothetical protein [Arcicella sp. LKC2W]MEA5458347.1 hypothetical protein [Arcicella sp. LKC2W]